MPDTHSSYRKQTRERRTEITDAVVAWVDAGDNSAHRLAERVRETFKVEWAPHAIQMAMRRAERSVTLTKPGAAEDPDLPVTLDGVEDMASRFLETYAPLRPVPERVRAVRREDMGFDTSQQAVALFSDLHYYSRIDRRATAGLAEYNIDIARERLATWRDGVLRFTQMSQLSIDIDTLHLFAMGDELEGHGSMFPTQALQMSESIFFQVMGFVEDMTGAVLALLEKYEKIRVYKVHGNHGRAGRSAKEAYGPDNWELVAWHLVAERVARHVGGE